MQNTALESRVRAAYRAQAAAAAFACGAATFALGSGLAVPMCLNAAYIAAVCAVPASGLAAYAACRLRARGPRPLLLCMALTAAALLLLLACAQLAGQLLLSRAAALYVCAVTLGGALLCALCGETGVSRLCFALRIAAPVLLAVLGVAGLSGQWHAGLFPLLGSGLVPLGLGACACLPACIPAMMLALPPAALADAGEDALACPPPPPAFFVRRAVLGSLAGALLTLLLTLCNAYETLRTLDTWGSRMVILSQADPHGGLVQELLTLVQLLALTLGASAMLAGAEQALLRFRPSMKNARAGLLIPAIVCTAAMTLSLVYGYGPLLAAAPATLAILALLTMIPMRRTRTI